MKPHIKKIGNCWGICHWKYNSYGRAAKPVVIASTLKIAWDRYYSRFRQQYKKEEKK